MGQIAECEFCRALPTGFNEVTQLYFCPDHEDSAQCDHPESECGICNDCGAEVDWVQRVFGA